MKVSIGLLLAKQIITVSLVHFQNARLRQNKIPSLNKFKSINLDHATTVCFSPLKSDVNYTPVTNIHKCTHNIVHKKFQQHYTKPSIHVKLIFVRKTPKNAPRPFRSRFSSKLTMINSWRHFPTGFVSFLSC